MTVDAFHDPTASRPFDRFPLARSAFWPLNAIAVCAIVFIDWLTPAGLVVGILLGVPILVTCISQSRAIVLATSGLAVAGFILAAAFGRGPISPEAIWLPNRIFALATLLVSSVVALHIQSRRLEAERRRDDALSASRLNQLLVSLVAHDLRAPLAMAIQALDYANDDAGRNDDSLLRDVGARLRRNLGSIDVLLDVARHELANEAGRPPVDRLAVNLVRELEAEVSAFTAEAALRDKTIDFEWVGAGTVEFACDLAVVRQAVAILIDNAIRYAAPGSINIRAGVVRDRKLHLSVCDAGPLRSRPASPANQPAGSGLGLALCHALVTRAGGRIEEQRSTHATTFVLHLPIATGPVRIETSNRWIPEALRPQRIQASGWRRR